MMPPIFEILSDDAGTCTLIGTPPAMRLFPFGEADQNTPKPYVTWQLITGQPENYLGNLPDADHYRVQLDTWADTQASAILVAKTIRDVLEPHGYVVGSGNTPPDPETRCYRYMLDMEFITPRTA